MPGVYGSISATVSTAPTSMAGQNPNRNFRAGTLSRSEPPWPTRRRIFASMVAPPSEAPTTAATIHTKSQRSGAAWRYATGAATSAVTPTPTSPQPGTSVNAAAPSMVRRMYDRS